MIFNMIRGPRAAFGTFIGQWRRGMMTTGSRRLCIKPQEGQSAPQQTPAEHTQRLGFKVPGYRPTDWDKKMLLWSGRYKTVERIPEFVTYEMIDSARNKVRIKICYIMMGLTILTCLGIIIFNKQTVGESQFTQNLMKKQKLREEAQKEKEEAYALAAKAQ